jgi:protein TonB
MLVALAGSILIHTGLIAATLALMRGRQTPPSSSRYLYVTLAPAAGPGIGTSADAHAVAAHSTNSGQAREIDLPMVAHDVAHVHRIVRRVAKELPRAAGLAPPVPAPSIPVKSSTAAPMVAKADAFNPAAISPNGGGASGSQAAGVRGADAAGSLPGVAAYRAPVLLSSVIPAYPEGARSRGIEGQVVLRFVVDQSGGVEPDVQVVTSLPMLDQAAIDAVRRWRFSPARDRDGNPVRVQVSVPLQFTLR